MEPGEIPGSPDGEINQSSAPLNRPVCAGGVMGGTEVEPPPHDVRSPRRFRPKIHYILRTVYNKTRVDGFKVPSRRENRARERETEWSERIQLAHWTFWNTKRDRWFRGLPLNQPPKCFQIPYKITLWLKAYMATLHHAEILFTYE